MRPIESESKEETAKAINRLIVIGRKKLPDINNHEKAWAHIEIANTDLSVITNYLSTEKYETKTLGSRELGPARLLGKATYSIIQKFSRTFLVYVLEYPLESEKGDEVHQAFNLKREASYQFAVKNPTTPNPNPYVGLPESDRVKYPEELQKVFENRKWTPVNVPELLNFEGVEMILVGSSDDLHKEFGDNVTETLEETAIDETGANELTVDSVYKELKKIKGANIDNDPILSLKWV